MIAHSVAGGKIQRDWTDPVAPRGTCAGAAADDDR